MPQKFEDLDLVKSLQTLACFAIAKELWSHPEIKQNIDVCLREEEYRNGNNCVSRMLVQLLNCVNELAKHLYPIVPIFFKSSISEVIDFIGEDIFDWIIVSENHHSGIIQEMIVWNVHLTPFHTVDRVKSGCISQNFNFVSENLCKCCFQKYVEKRWKKLDPKLKEKFELFFGRYKFHAIAYWKCYVHIVDYRITQEKIIVRNRQLFENFSPLENIFKISVYCGYDVAVVYYWNQLTNQQKVNNINALLSKKYSPVSKLEAWMERWTNETITSKAQSSTFCFLWNQLPEFYRRKLMLFSYWSVFILIIRWHINDHYFRQIFSTWRPMFIAPKFYERTLRVAASNITKGEKHEKIFNYLWKPVASLYSNENVAEFIWKYLTVYEDIESAAFIINKFEKRKKIEIMASLNQMLYVYNVNQKYQSRLQDFLTTEISLHQPAGDIQIDMNDDSEPEPGVQKISLFILFLIFLVYLFFIFMCIITPSSRTHELKRFLSLH